MKRLLFFLFVLLSYSGVRAATYSGEWTNAAGVLKPRSATTQTVTTNLLSSGHADFLGPIVKLTKSISLSLGTNTIPVWSNAVFILTSPTNDATLVTLRLAGGTNTVQEVKLINNGGGFTLPDGSTNLVGGIVNLNNHVSWVTTNLGDSLNLFFNSPNWNEDSRTSTNGFTGGTVINPTDGVLPYRSSSSTFGDSPVSRLSATNAYVRNLTIGSDSSWFNPAFGVATISGKPLLDTTANGSSGILLNVYSAPTTTTRYGHQQLMVATGAGNFQDSYGAFFENDMNSKSATWVDPLGGTVGGWFDVNAAGALQIGLIGNSRGGATNNFGVYARSRNSLSGSTNVSMLASFEPSGTQTHTAGFFDAGVVVSQPVVQNSMVTIDNRSTGYPLLIARTNNGTIVAQIFASGLVSNIVGYAFGDATVQTSAAGPSAFTNSGTYLSPTNTNHRVRLIGANGVNTLDVFGDVTFKGESNPNLFLQSASDLQGQISTLAWRRSRGTIDSPSAVTTNDFLLEQGAQGWDGSAYSSAAAYWVKVDGAVAASDVPGRFEWWTKASGVSGSEKMRLTSTGNLGLGTTNPATIFETTGTITSDALSVTNGVHWMEKFYTNIYQGNLAKGSNDIYTVPSGYRALVARMVCSTTNTTTTSTVWLSKTNGTYYRIGATNNITTTSAADIAAATFIYEQNETIAVYNSTNGLNVCVGFYLYTNTIPLLTARKYALANGNNTLYTVPSGKMASYTAVNAIAYSAPGVAIVNNSGGSRNYAFNFVPNGGAISTTNQYGIGVAVPDGSITLKNPTPLRNGDFLNVNTDSGAAGQVAWFTVWEQ